jgi:hypothetical protein
MPMPAHRRIATLFDRLLRPQRAARNAEEAAAEATRTVRERERVEQDLASQPEARSDDRS